MALLKVTAEGIVDLPRGNLDILAHPEIIEGPGGEGGANDLAGLTVPVRIEGPLDDPRIRPQIGGVFANPDTPTRSAWPSASNAVSRPSTIWCCPITRRAISRSRAARASVSRSSSATSLPP